MRYAPTDLSASIGKQMPAAYLDEIYRPASLPKTTVSYRIGNGLAANLPYRQFSGKILIAIYRIAGYRHTYRLVSYRGLQGHAMSGMDPLLGMDPPPGMHPRSGMHTRSGMQPRSGTHPMSGMPSMTGMRHAPPGPHVGPWGPMDGTQWSLPVIGCMPDIGSMP